MSTKQRFWGTFLAGLLVATSARAGDQTGQVGKAPRTTGVQSVAPVVQRRAVLPAGWFQTEGNSPGTLTGSTASGVRPVVHYDTMGAPAGKDEASGVPNVARRLRQLRKATSLPNLAPAGSSPAVTEPPLEAASSDVTGLPTVPNPGATGAGPSSRRRAGFEPVPSDVSGQALPNAAAAVPTQSMQTVVEGVADPSFAPALTAPVDASAVETSGAASNAAQPPTTVSVPATPAEATTENVEPTTTQESAATTASSASDSAVSNESADVTGSGDESVESTTVGTAPSTQEPAPQAVPQKPLPSVMQRKPSPTSSATSAEPVGTSIEMEAPTAITENEVSDRGAHESSEAMEEPSTETATTESSESGFADPETTADATQPLKVRSGPARVEAESLEEDGVILSDEAPVISVKTKGPKTIVVGKMAKYIIVVENRGDGAAKDLVVRINIPPWVEVADDQASVGAARIEPDESGQATLAWSVGSVASHGQEKLTLGLIPRSSRPIDLGVTWTFAPAASTTLIQVQEPKLHMNVVGPQDVLFGGTKVYTLTVSNPGTGDADNVVLSLLPLVPGEKSAGVRPLGMIPAGGRRTVEVELTARQTGRLQVRAEATADGGLSARGEQDVLVRRASLDVVAEGAPKKYAGTRSRYAVRVTNSGDATAAETMVVATLPAGAQAVASSDGGVFNPQHGQVQWSLGELRPGASRVLELECTLVSPGDNRLDVRTAAAGDLSALASVTTRVEALADLKMTVNDPQGAVAVGADVTYEVRIVNRGTKAAENIDVFGYFSEGVEPTTVAGWRGSVGEGEVALQSIPRLAPGQEMLIRITAQASRPGDHVFRAELECQEPETKLAVEEWTRFYGEEAGEEMSVEPVREATRRPASTAPRKRR